MLTAPRLAPPLAVGRGLVLIQPMSTSERSAVPESIQRAAVALGGSPLVGVHRRRGARELPMQLLTRALGGVGLLIQSRRVGRGAAPLSGSGDEHDVLVRPEPHTDLVARTDLLCGLGAFSVDLHLAAVNSLSGERARLEEARRPQPLVQAHRRGRYRTLGGRFSRHLLNIASGSALVLALAACESAADKEARAQQEARASMAEATATADRAAATPSTGLWTPEHLVERLVRAGVAPRRVEDAPAGPEWMGAARHAFLAGGGELHAWIYADSSARRVISATLDTATATPAGRAIPYELPITLVVQNNLIAVISGGNARNHERIALALQAGLPVSGAATP